MQVESGYVAVDNARLYYEVAGVGAPLVLIHAGVADQRMWDDQFHVFARQHRVVRYDLRGYHNSRMPNGTFAHYDDLAALLRHLDLPRAAIVGCSFGGSVALSFALAHPQMVRALVLVASAIEGWEWSEEFAAYDEAETSALERGDIDAAIELNLRTWVDGPRRAPCQVTPAVREKVRTMLRESLELEQGDGEERELEPPALARLAEISVPALVVVGDADTHDITAMAERLATTIPSARKVVVPNAAHLLSVNDCQLKQAACPHRPQRAAGLPGRLTATH